MKFAKTITCSVIFLIAGCQSIPIYVPDHKVFVDGDTLVYDGMISGEAVLEALRAVRESNTQVKKLAITSQGGDMSAGIELGFFIKEHNWDVEVRELCFSACANYVLPAAKSVTIDANSLLGWHGGAMQPDELWAHSIPKSSRAVFMDYIAMLREKETRFFDTVGVDQNITTYGQTTKNSCQLAQKTDGWYYSVEDLKRMGIKNITIKGDGLLSEIEYANDSTNKTDPTTHKIKSCLMENVFESG
ncbi:hypothetical protein [Vibrio ezurae]|uniref:Lipoprotein n=1 Tax=Vibrio ezurae NBRC 102218 TaxID=1219080 RepID=U3CFZ7_9VIBR|nr:hypothetical protein [Vibrio ezurae]GAD80154.1 hypothetical protein VEZ01S_25_00370 [Vibrio ezurae NBRC 102218]